MFQNYEDTARIGKSLMDTGLKSAAGMQKSMQAIAQEAGDYSKKTFETGAAAMQQLFAVRSPEKAMEVHADYLRRSYESFVAQSARMGELLTEAAKDAYKPFEQMVAKTK
jgi:hypothetical protein